MGDESGGLSSVKMMDGWHKLALVVLTISFSFGLTGATECYRNDDLGEVAENIYYCNGETNECCEEDMQFTCCEPQNEKTLEKQLKLLGRVMAIWMVLVFVLLLILDGLKEQLILWGGVLAIGLVIALLCCYFWKDCNCLREDTRFSKVCCCRKKVDEEPLTSIDDPRPAKAPNWPPTGPSFSGSRGYGREVDDTETPPPFFYKSSSYGKY